MVNVNKIKRLSKQHGISLSFICGKIGVAKVYFNDIEKSGRDIPDDRLSVIADLLDTTIEYLRDETAEEKKNLSPSDDQVKVALFGGDEEVTDEMWEEVKNFVAFVKGKNKK